MTGLHGQVRVGAPLLVLALHSEAQFLRTTLPVLITGVGKVNAALAVAEVLAGGLLPSEVVNFGTAGALRPGLVGTHEVSEVLEHDLDGDILQAMTGGRHTERITLAGRGPVLATGDVFVDDDLLRARLGTVADLVDMEGYAVARAAGRRGVPVRLIKHVSDEAGDGAARTWAEAVEDCARRLAASVG